MNVACPSCQTVFRVDPDRVPPAGVRVRCAQCPGTFRLSHAGARAGGAGAAAESNRRTEAQLPAPPAQAPGRAHPRTSDRPPEPRPGPGPVAAMPGSPARSAAPDAAAGAGPAASGPTRPAPAFGATDPLARAQRLARALVSDMVAYHPERRERALREGTLRGEFRDEIMKSWEEYVAQVGDGLARGTPFFRDALNEILAGGQKSF
jgi:predicted Zn finger-like uncharacterized protein